MTDDIQPLEARITKIIGEEERLNRTRKSALKVNDDRRNIEKRKEDTELATLETEKKRQLQANTVKETDFQKLQDREGKELVGFSKEIQSEYLAELEHRKLANNALKQKVTVLEAKLRTIEAGRS